MTLPTNHQALIQWVREFTTLLKPEAVEWCNGSKQEFDTMAGLLVEAGLATPLKNRPDSYLFRSDPSDVARVEKRTYISTKSKQEAGPTNNWIDPDELKVTMKDHFRACMAGRTLYVIPFSMGPVGSHISKIGVQLTDSPYVVMNMHIMTRVGTRVLEVLGDDGEFIPCVHSVGKPLAKGESDNGEWPCAPMEKKYICHFPEERTIWSFGSGYGGNALLGKKCLALRIASAQARDEGWLAEHMLILKLTNPEGKTKHVAAAFPSACGKTNLAMLIPTLPGWKVETVGDDIAWMTFNKDGRLHAINPEAGFFGVAPGTSYDSNPNAMDTLKRDCIFTNVALTEEGDVWWEGIGHQPPGPLIDWLGNRWVAGREDHPAAHPNSRFSAKAANCPSIAPNWEDPQGVPIDAILFGGRRPSTIPLVHEAFNWEHGVFMGSIVGSEVTAAVLDMKVGTVRRDPMAMLPFCGYNMGDYFQHWIDIGKQTEKEKRPHIFYVNWFRKTAEGKWLWPGFGENSRVLEWVFNRCDGQAPAVETPIGLMPDIDAFPRPNGVSEEDMKELLSVDREGWLSEIHDVRTNHYPKFGDRLPVELSDILDQIESKLRS